MANSELSLHEFRLSLLILVTHPEAALVASPFEPKIETDIHKFQHVDFGCFDVILCFGVIN